jgi:hypothetical protein
LIGAGVGLAAGLGILIAGESSDGCRHDDEGLCPVVLGAVATVLTTGGALVGAVAGGMTHTDRWERVNPRRLSVAVMPDPRGGIRGRLAVRF